MANKKITDLPAGNLARADDVIEIVQDIATTAVSNQVSMEELPFNQVNIPPATADALDDEFEASVLDAKWTWVNQGGATAVGSKGSLQFAIPLNAGDSARLLYQATPSTPWEMTAKVSLVCKPNTNYFFAGLMMMASGSGKIIAFWIGYDGGDKISVFRWTSTTALSDVPYSDAFSSRSTYLRIADDGTNLIFSQSVDGITFFPLYSQARTSFFTAGPDRIGLAVNANNGTYGCTGSFDWFRRTA